MPSPFQSVFFDAHPLPGWICELGTFKILHINRAVIRQFGFAKSYWIKAGFIEKVEGSRFIKNRSRVSLTLVSRKGEVHTVELRKTYITVAGKKVVWIVASPAQQEKTDSTNFQYLFENNPLPMWIYDTDTFQFLEVNDTATQKYGYSKAEFCAKTILDIRPEEDQQKLAEYIGKVPKYSQSGSWRHVLKNGQVINVDVYSHSFLHKGRNARLIVANDVTEKRRAEDEIKKLAAIVAHTSNVVILTDKEGKITWANKGFERVTGYTLKEALGKKPGKLLQGEETDSETVARMRIALEKREALKAEVLNYSKSGKKYWVDIEMLPLKDDAGEFIGYMAIESDITVLKTAVREMLKSQILLQTIMDNVPLLVFLKNLRGQYTFYNQSFKKVYPADLQKKSFTDYDFLPRAIADKSRESDYFIAKTKKTLTMEHDIPMNGKSESYYTIKFPLLDERNRPFAIGGVSMRITERKHAEQLLKESREKLEKQNRILEIITQAQEEFIREVEPAVFFKSVIINILCFTESELGFIGEILFEDQQTTLKLHAIETLNPRANGWQSEVNLQVNETFLEDVVKKGKPFTLESDQDIQNLMLTGINMPIRSFLGIPVLKGTRRVGIIGLANRTSGYSPSVTKDIQPVIGVLGSIIEAIRNDQQRREAEQNLRESEQRFKALADSAPVLIWMTDVDRKEIYYSKSFLSYIGASHDDALANGWFSYVHEQDRVQSMTLYNRSFDLRQSFSIEYRLRCADGRYRWVIDSGSPRYLPNGQFVGFIGTCTDIHERKLAEQSLLESETRYKSIVNNQLDMICRYAHGGILTFANKSYADTFGVEQNQLIGKSFSEFVSLDNKRFIDFIVEDIFENGCKVQAVEQHVIIKGEKRWQHWIHIPLKNSADEVYEVQAIGQDITSRKALEAEQARLDKIVRETYNEICLFHWDSLAFEFINDAAMDNLGCQEKEITNMRFTDLFNYPDEMAIQALLNPLKRGETDRIQLQIKFNRKDGTFYDGDTSIQVLERDRSFVAITTDITQKLSTEKKLLSTILEKEILIKEIHHRVKNNLQLISSIIYIKMASLKEPELKYFLETTRQRIRSIALIHERLLQTEMLNKIDIKDYLSKLVHDLQVSNFRPDLELQIITNLEDHSIDLDAAIYCGLIVNELITNAIKHAFKGRTRGVITVELRREQDLYFLSVGDDGVTMPEDVSPGQTGSFGMSLLEIFIRQLHGTIDIIREEGTKFQIRFGRKE